MKATTGQAHIQPFQARLDLVVGLGPRAWVNLGALAILFRPRLTVVTPPGSVTVAVRRVRQGVPVGPE